MVKFFIERPIAVTMSLIAIVVLGLLSMNMIPVSLMPNIDIPQITVQVNSPNLSAREVDAQIVKSLRYQLMQIPHLENIRAESHDGGGTIFMQFEHGSNIDYIFIEVNERIDRAMSQLPQDIERPKVMKASAADIPAFYLNLTLKDAGTDSLLIQQKFTELSRFAISVISKRLEQLPHVAMVDISGQSSSEIVIIPDTDKMQALGISLATFETAILNHNLNLSSLVINDGQYQYNIRFSLPLTNKQEIEDIYLSIDGRLYKIKDLATVREQVQKRQGLTRSDGKLAVTMAVIKQSDSRMSDLKKSIDELTASFENDYPHIDFTITRDQTALLDYSIDNLSSNLIVGIILACLVIFIFMHDFRSPALITLTIPLSLVVAILGLYALGISINIISLSGLILGVGMMVDNSIIVIDNISQRWDRGESLKEATVKGTNEVIAPLLSSVLTTCAVFLPLIFMSGITGALFYDQGMAVAVGLFASLLVAITVIPVYYYAFYKKLDRRHTNQFLKKLDVINYDKIYETGLKWTFRHQPIAWGAILFMIAGTVILFMVIEKQKLPDMSQDDLLLNIEWNQNITVEENDKRISELLSECGDIVTQSTVMAGQQQFILQHTKENTVSEAVTYIKVKSSDDIERLNSLIVRFLQDKYPDAVFSTERSGNIFDMIFADKDPKLVARIRSANGKSIDPSQLNVLLSEIKRALPDIYVEPAAWQEVIMLQTRPEILSLYDISPEEVYKRLLQALNEYTVLTIREGQYSIPVRIGDNKDTFDKIYSSASITTVDSVEVPLRTLLIEGQGKDLKDIVSGPEGDFYPLNLELADKEVPYVVEKISKIVNADPGYDVSFSGTYYTNRAMLNELMVILVVSLLLLYFILAAQFESLIQPVIIMSEIAADLFGALFLLWICGSSLNVMSMIGIIVMCGIVINDSILKVDTINHLRKDGYNLKRAIMMAGARRLKPIIMTTLTTVLAIVPFIFSEGMGADMQLPLSLAVIGGMSIGTIVSIFFIPLAYYYIYNRKH